MANLAKRRAMNHPIFAVFLFRLNKNNMKRGWTA
jgi:hypothetical protein